MEVSGRNQIGNDDVDTGIQCDPCALDNETVTAQVYCTDCDEFLCNTCAKVHKKSKALRHHKLLDKTEMPRKKLTATQEKFCSVHSGEPIKYFCDRHDLVCCSVCATLKHKHCRVLYIDDIAEREYGHLLTQIKDLDGRLAETKKQTETNCETVHQCYSTLIFDIHQFRKLINTKLDDLERKITEEANKVKTDDLRSMESTSTQCENIKKYLKEMSSSLQNLKKYQQTQQLFITSKRYLEEVKDIDKEIEEISFENKIRNYLFLWNEEILQSLDVCCELVHLHVKDREGRNLQKEKQSKGDENIMSNDPRHIKANFVRNIKIEHERDSSIDWCIAGCDLLTYDTLALTDHYNFSVKLVDLHTDTIKSCLQLADKPLDITCMDSNTLVVTCYTDLTFLKFDGELSITKQLPTKDGCSGITSHQNKLFVTFTVNPSIKVLNSSGAVFYIIQTNSIGKRLFIKPEYITLSTDGRTIYVSDREQNRVTSYCVTGEKLNVYKRADLERPAGLTVIENKCVFVCGLESDNLHEISCQCEHIKIMLDSKNVGEMPRTVLYNRTKNMIYISYEGNNFVSVFKLE